MKTIKIPTYFEYTNDDRNDVIGFFQTLFKCKSKDSFIILDISSTKTISEGAFLTLKAQVEKINKTRSLKQRYTINGAKAREVVTFLKKHFVAPAKSNTKEFHVDLDVKKGMTADSETDPIFVDNIVRDLRMIGVTEYFDPFYDFLVELIGNATEHGIKHKNINWWLMHYRDYESRAMRYTFVDMGRGIVRSHKENHVPLKYHFLGDSRIVKDSMDGKLLSSTKQKNRGKGLPFIKLLVTKGWISDFLLVTNRVIVHYDGKNIVYSRCKNFIGTYFSWSINNSNIQQWKNTR